jgi:hypothetical protein
MKLAIELTDLTTAEVTALQVGDFCVHRPARRFVLWREPPTQWHVTHIASKMKFPCVFPDKDGAIRFARQVKHLMDWSKVKVGRESEDSDKTVWIEGAPTSKQKEAVEKLWEACGGIRE